jgi:hypothetical protein
MKCNFSPYRCEYLSYTFCSLHTKLCTKLTKQTDKIIVGFKGEEFKHKFIYLHDEKHKPIKRKPGNPSPRLHSLVFGKYTVNHK